MNQLRAVKFVYYWYTIRCKVKLHEGDFCSGICECDHCDCFITKVRIPGGQYNFCTGFSELLTGDFSCRGWGSRSHEKATKPIPVLPPVITIIFPVKFDAIRYFGPAEPNKLIMQRKVEEFTCNEVPQNFIYDIHSKTASKYTPYGNWTWINQLEEANESPENPSVNTNFQAHGRAGTNQG